MNTIFNNIGNNNIYLIIGNGSKNQFKSIIKLKILLKDISKQIPLNSYVLYFGDPSNKLKPDIGFAIYQLKNMRPDIKILMIQIQEFKKYGVPDWVNYSFFHNDYSKTDPNLKYGGLTNKGIPVSNTKQWVILHKKLLKERQYGISRCFILGGGNITLDEYKLCNKLIIPVKVFEIERRFLGDGKTKIDKHMTKKNKIGSTYKLITKTFTPLHINKNIKLTSNNNVS